MTGKCMNFQEPDLQGLTEAEAITQKFNHALIVESCADIVSAELTSAEDVLETLRFLIVTWADSNPILYRRVQVMERIIQLEQEKNNE